MLQKTPEINRRELVRAGVVGGGASIILLASSSAAWATAGAPSRDKGGDQAKDGTMNNDGSSEPDLRADDLGLSPRSRELIRIGEVGIARENEAAMAKFFHPEFRFHGPDGTSLTREQLWSYFAACRAAFDDFAVNRQQIFSDGGDNLAARTTFSGVFVRPFTASPVGTVQPNGKLIFYRINNIFRYAPDGTLAEEWAQYDSRLFLERLGVVLVAAR